MKKKKEKKQLKNWILF